MGGAKGGWGSGVKAWAMGARAGWERSMEKKGIYIILSTIKNKKKWQTVYVRCLAQSTDNGYHLI